MKAKKIRAWHQARQAFFDAAVPLSRMDQRDLAEFAGLVWAFLVTTTGEHVKAFLDVLGDDEAEMFRAFVVGLTKGKV